MEKPETAVTYFNTYNCAQSTLLAYATDFALNKDTALQVAVGFGGGIGRIQDVCGAVSASVMVLGLASGFTESDGRSMINESYDITRRFVEEFEREYGTIKCRELIKCDLCSEEGQKYFKENNVKENCRGYVRFCCTLLDKYMAEK